MRVELADDVVGIVDLHGSRSTTMRLRGAVNSSLGMIISAAWGSLSFRPARKSGAANFPLLIAAASRARWLSSISPPGRMLTTAAHLTLPGRVGGDRGQRLDQKRRHHRGGLVRYC